MAARDSRAFLLGLRSQGLLAQAVAAAASLGIADVLAGGPKSAEAIAQACGAAPDPVFRLLRALAGHGIFIQLDDGNFALTDAAELLRRDVDDSLYPLLGGEFPALVRQAYEELAAAVCAGDVPFERAHGAGFFEYLAANPAANRAFDTAMARVAALEHPVIAQNFDFSRFNVIADIGGGRGGLLAAILQHYPAARGILFDQPQVIEEPAELADLGLPDRCDRVPGDFFRAVPPGADLYLLKRILHDWDDEQAVAILRVVRSAMAPAARLVIVDAVMQPGNAPDPNKDLDLNMLVLTGGRERTAAEFAELLDSAGLELLAIRALPAPVTLSIVEARSAPAPR